MVAIGLVIFAGGFVLFSRTDSLWMFYLAFVVVSLGAGLGSWLPANTALNNWFRLRRSTAMSIPMLGFGHRRRFRCPAHGMGNGLGRQSRRGDTGPARLAEYRAAGGRHRTGGVGCLWRCWCATAPRITACTRTALIRKLPHRPGRQRTANGGGTVAPDYTWQEAVRTRAFWLITMGHASSSIIIISVMFYLGLLMVERGFGLGQISGVISAQTAVSTAFILVGGIVGDRVPIRLAIFGFSFLQSIAMVVLLTAETLPHVLPVHRADGHRVWRQNPPHHGPSSWACILGAATSPGSPAFP